MNAKNGKYLGWEEDFCQPGDSGALVIDSMGNAAGLLYSNYSGQTGPLGQGYGWYCAAGIATPNIRCACINRNQDDPAKHQREAHRAAW